MYACAFRPLLIAAVLFLAGPSAADPRFSLDPASPAIDGSITPDDVLKPGPAVATPGTSLGLSDGFFTGSFDNLDALSRGRDPVTRPGRTIPLFFSVDRVAVGLPGSDVFARAAPGVESAAGDVYRALPPFGTNTLMIFAAGLGLLEGFFGDDLDGLELDSGDGSPTYFSIDALSAGNGFGGGAAANDIFCSSFVTTESDGACGGGTLFASGESRIGLRPGDDIDGLALWDVVNPGVLDPGIDLALFSLTPFSPSTYLMSGNDYIPGMQDFLSPADVLFTDFTGGFGLWATAGAIGLRPDDNVDALDTVPEPGSLALVALGLLSLWRLGGVRGACRRPGRHPALLLLLLLLGGSAVAQTPVFFGKSPPVQGSGATLTLNADPAAQRTFQWESSDFVLGRIVTSTISATTWRFIPGSPARVVFVGSEGSRTFYGDVLLEPYNRAVVDIVEFGKRVRYLLAFAKLTLSIHKPPVIDAAEPEIPDADKLSKGAQTFVNLDNDDGDDKFDTGTGDSKVAGENEMVKVRLRLSPKDKVKPGIVKLDATGKEQILVWRKADKDTQYVLGSNLAVPGDFTAVGDELVATLWVEGVAPHTAQQGTKLKMSYDQISGLSDDAALTVIGIESITWQGRNNSLADNNTLDADPKFRNVDGSALAPGGLRVFPDARVAAGAVEAAPRNRVDVVATLSVKPVEALRVFFRSFDVDDPSADTGPVDDPSANIAEPFAVPLPAFANETVAEDNRGTVAIGAVASRAGAFVAAAGAVAIAERDFTEKTDTFQFTTTTQPGDNFRVVGNGDRAFLEALANDDNPLNVGADANVRNANKQRIVDPRILATKSPTDSEVRQPAKYASNILTVWRFLHVEVDSMVAPPAAGNAQSNFVDRVLAGVAGNGTVAQRVNTTADIPVRVDTDGDAAADTPDDTLRLDTAPAGNGRFQGGRVAVGNTNTAGLDGNGVRFVRRNAGIDIPFRASNAAVADATGNVIALAGTTVTLSVTGGALAAAHNGGKLNIAGVDMDITAVDVANSRVTIARLNDIVVRLHDDDDDAGLPRDPLTDFMQASDARLDNLYADAYIRPVYDGGGNPANNTRTVPILLNTESEQAYLRAPATGWRSRGNNSERFWVAYVLSAFQDSVSNLRQDLDDNAERATGGSTAGVGGSLSYVESIRERIPTASTRPGQPGDLERRIVTHEVGHAMTLGHGNSRNDLPANGIMNTSAQDGPTVGDANFRFVPFHLNKLRRLARPNS